MKLVTVLKDYRRNKSTELGIPPYRVYSNNVLNEIASKRSGTKEALLSIKGFGKKTYEHYGECAKKHLWATDKPRNNESAHTSNHVVPVAAI